MKELHAPRYGVGENVGIPTCRWSIVGDFRYVVQYKTLAIITTQKRVTYDETRVVVRKTKRCWREFFRLDHDNRSFRCDERSSLGRVLPVLPATRNLPVTCNAGHTDSVVEVAAADTVVEAEPTSSRVVHQGFSIPVGDTRLG